MCTFDEDTRLNQISFFAFGLTEKETQKLAIEIHPQNTENQDMTNEVNKFERHTRV